MDTQKVQVPASSEVKGEVATPVPPKVEEQTTVEGQPQQDAQPRTVPLDELVKFKKKYKELQAEMAGLRGKEAYSGYDPEETEKVLSHPMVQELLIKTAKQEVTDYTRDYLQQYPEFPEVIKKAILRNVRGFINETTTDPETAKIDVAEYIDEVWADLQNKAGTQRKEVKVTPPNVGAILGGKGTKPADIQAILDKPVDEWSDEEMAKLDSYSQSAK